MPMTDEDVASMSNEQIHAEVAKAGLRVVHKDALDVELLAKRLDNLTTESHESLAATLETRDAIKQLGEDMKLLLEIRGEIGKIWRRVTDLESALPVVVTRVAYLEGAKSAHAETLTSHENDITGLHKRLVVVEETVTKKPAKRRKRKARK